MGVRRRGITRAAGIAPMSNFRGVGKGKGVGSRSGGSVWDGEGV